MSFHRLSYGIRVCRVRNIEHAIKCVQAEAIVVDATKVFGAGTFVAASTSIADSVDSTFRNFTFVEMRDIRWNVVNQPMNPMVGGIQIFDINTRLLASSGTSRNSEGGLTFGPLHENLSGTGKWSPKSRLEIFIWAKRKRLSQKGSLFCYWLKKKKETVAPFLMQVVILLVCTKSKVVFKNYTPNQIKLLPQSLEERIDKNHPVRIVNQVIDKIDIDPLLKKFKGGGTSSYHPRMLLKV